MFVPVNGFCLLGERGSHLNLLRLWLWDENPDKKSCYLKKNYDRKYTAFMVFVLYLNFANLDYSYGMRNAQNFEKLGFSPKTLLFLNQ